MALADRWLLPDGIMELLPPQARQVELMRRKVLDLYHRWGYELVMPPIAEHLESLLTGVGHDLDLNTFKVTDRLSGHTLGVRADMTPQVARIDAHRLRTEGPSRLCYCGSVLHTHAANMLASRNPLQLGAELYGHAGPDSDVEVIALMLATLDEVGVQGSISLDLGHVGVFSRLMELCGLEAQQQADYQDMLQRKALPEIDRFIGGLEVLSDTQRSWLCELPRLNGGAQTLARARTLFAGDDALLAAVDYLSDLAQRVAARFPSVDAYFDLSELRGYHYHTGIVFAAYTPSFGQALAKGGRYDNIGRDFGRARPATGFSADLKTLMDLSGQLVEQADDVVLAPAGEAEGLQAAIAELRKSGTRVVQQLEGETNCGGRYRQQLVHEGGDWVLTDL
ncbi:ATP phosphoribosyltransferase regulatory subunit [Marinobacterium weihaiense]|uniref:ATP phosphoribosyltransferase regulatory subunit n=1 Tax=Marinobacterium weihaiense TaxID=2851016 RepID=A0ABS6MCQ9_9GAMM|nr:ATP phosphoribosyltransferase regulatory subunit [Marinobacterium weihaiense]MBV0934093.1 ATP phosphoribosyltransferase regulatory subunit [Marinobacterium weihaiense]